MGDIPEDDLAASRAAFAQTLAATTDILPWVAKARPPRFDGQLNERWKAAAKALTRCWADRHAQPEAVRTAIFVLYRVALETADSDCLHLGEALASAADRLEDGPPSPRLLAALSGTIETLDDAAGLEHPTFIERARHFAKRLENSAQLGNVDERSPVIDHLFVNEAMEQLGLMEEALAALPVDAYVLASESARLAEHAEGLELWGIMHLAKQLAECIRTYGAELDAPVARQSLEKLIQLLRSTIATVDG